MKLLYSNILPMRARPGQLQFLDEFQREVESSDLIEIASGYASTDSIIEIENILAENPGKKFQIDLGMYYIEGMPERMYRVALRLAHRMREKNQGKISLVRPFKYHGKVYAFFKNGKPVKAFIGSHNLSAIKLTAENRRQYEISAMTDDPEELQAIAEFLEELSSPLCSCDIIDAENVPLIAEQNNALVGVQEVSQLPPNSVDLYFKHKTDISFEIPLKVPTEAEKFDDEHKHFTKSNINVAYAAPRSKRKSRDWYEIQLTVNKSITTLPGYPQKKHPFFIVTDDGYWFKAHTTSDGNKQLNAVGNELLIGRWLKGRLVAAGLIEPVNDTQKDKNRTGMITKEILDAYGRNTLILTKTDLKALDGDSKNNPDQNDELDVWTLSFEAKKDE